MTFRPPTLEQAKADEWGSKTWQLVLTYVVPFVAFCILEWIGDRVNGERIGVLWVLVILGLFSRRLQEQWDRIEEKLDVVLEGQNERATSA